MRRDLLCAAVAAFLLLRGTRLRARTPRDSPARTRRNNRSSPSRQRRPLLHRDPRQPPHRPAATAQAPSSQSTVVSPPQQTTDPLVAAARKAREQKKDQAGAKPPRVFNNDNIPTQGGVSAVGQNPSADAADGAEAAEAPRPRRGLDRQRHPAPTRKPGGNGSTSCTRNWRRIRTSWTSCSANWACWTFSITPIP